MIYQAYDQYTRSAEVMNRFISMNQQIISHPMNPFSRTIMGKGIKSTLETMYRQTKTYHKLPFNITKTTINAEVVDVNEEISLSKPFCNLLHFKADTTIKKPKLLLVAPLSGHHATLIKDTVKTLMSEHDVYVTDWLDCKYIPVSEGKFGFDDYVSYVIEFMEHIGKNTHLLAICQSSVQALVATAVMKKEKNPNIPKSLTLIAGPIDTSINPNKVNDYASSKDLDFFKNNVIHAVPDRYSGAGRKVYPGFLQLSSFIAMNPESHLKKHVSYFGDVFNERTESEEHHREFYDEYMSVLDLSEDFFIETLEKVFIDQHLARGILTYNGELVDLSVITDTPLHTIEGEKDDICSLGQTKAAQDLCVNIPEDLRKNDVFEGVGHYGTFSGSTFRKNISPSITDFINKHDLKKK